jgi:ABC-type branched-subunit amino acid transport system ATPase component
VTSTHVLAASDVSRLYSGVRAVDGVTFQAAQGDVIGLIGPNGSGKTTLLNILTRMTDVSQGTVSLDGVNITHERPQRMAHRGVARTFQNIKLFNNLTVLENVEVGAAGARRPRRDAISQLERLGVANISGRIAGTLPYGDQRRVEIARALAAKPWIILLDEPAAGMNEAETDDLLTVLRRVQAETGAALIVVEHDLSLVFRLAERIVVLNNGRVIADGTADEVRAHPEVIDAYLGPALVSQRGGNDD